MRVVVAGDIGNENIKIVTSKNIFTMKNKVDKGKWIDTDLTKNNNTFNVIYKNEKYVVGNYAERYSTRMEKKNSTSHLINCLVALSRVINSGSKVYLTLGESLNAYFNVEHKKKIKENFIGEHEIFVNDKRYIFFIEDIHILPESVGHKLLNYQNYKGNRVSYTIDMGSSTINYGYYEGLLPIESRSSAYTLGMHNLISNISKSFSRSGGPNNTSPQQIRDYIEFGCKNQKLKNIIDTEINKQFDKLDSLLEADGTRLYELDEVEFCGGVSITLEKYIKDRYKNAIIVEDPLWSNCKGFFRFSCQRFNK